MKLWKLLILSGVLVLFMGMTTAQDEDAAGGLPSGMKEIAAGIAIGLSALGAGHAVGVAGAAAIGSITEKPELLGKALIFVAFGEALAIYGLLVAFMILFNIGA